MNLWTPLFVMATWTIDVRAHSCRREQILTHFDQRYGRRYTTVMNIENALRREAKSFKHRQYNHTQLRLNRNDLNLNRWIWNKWESIECNLMFIELLVFLLLPAFFKNIYILQELLFIVLQPTWWPSDQNHVVSSH